jgi:REP-associated tyrosine transposase
MFTRRPEHLKAFDYVGLHRYFLTFCTFERQRRFGTREHVAIVHEQFLRAAEHEGFEIPAYCFMPDHVHLLVEARFDDCDGRRFIGRAKQFSGFYYKRALGQSLWQRYGFERTLRADEPSLAVARYILENPVRAGLVKAVQDYPFTGSSIYTVRQILESVQMKDKWYGSG